MALSVTERWSRVGLRKDGSKWQADRAWDVVGSSDELRVIDSPDLPRHGSAHPKSGRLRLIRKRILDRPGLNFYIVGARYSTDPSQNKQSSEDPLDEPPEIDWDFAEERVEFDQDIEENPVISSAKNPPRNAPTKDGGPVKLIITRNEPFFDSTRAVSLRNLINTDSFSVSGRLMFGPKVGRILSVKPSRSYTADSDYVPVRYEFECREPYNIDGRSISAHHYRMADLGTEVDLNPGPNGGGGKRKILGADGEPVQEPQRLNGKGGLYGTGDGRGKPEGAVIQNTGFAVWLIYRRYPEGSYRQLGFDNFRSLGFE